MSSQFSCSVFFFVPCSWKHCWNSFPCLLIEILLCNVWRRYTVLQIAIYCEIVFFGFFFCGLLVPYIYVCVCVRVCLYTYFVSELKEYLSFTLKCLAWTVYLFHYDVGRLEPLILGTSIMCSMLTCIMYSWFSYRCVNTLFLHLLYIYDNYIFIRFFFW